MNEESQAEKTSIEPIGRRLAEERKRLELGQDVMGSIGGVERKAQGNYEAGRRAPDAAYLAALGAYGVDVLYVLTGRREAKRQAPAALPAQTTTEPPPKWGVSREKFLEPVSSDTTHPGAPLMGGFPVTKGGDLLPAEGVAGAALHWVWQGAGERREYRVIPNITEHVCAGVAPAEDGAGQLGARHAKAGVLAFESRYMRAALGSDDDRYMTLQVEGDSMVPTLLDGDLVAIDISATRINVSGIYVLRFAGQLTIKRVMRKSDGSVIISSDNRAYAAADEIFTAPAAESLAVVGRMVWPRVR